MTIAASLRAAAQRLERVDASGALDAGRLLEHVTGWGRARLIAHGDETLSEALRAAFAALVDRRAAGEPVAYLTGTAGFYGRSFAVDARVLVPRPESEHLVEAALDDLRGRRKTAGTVVDVGTGSGALAVTLACELPELGAFGTDVSTDALAVARANAAALRVFQRCTFLHGDLLAPVRRFAPVDAVLANLPYIPTTDVPARPHPVGFEPRVALDGGADGLDLYRRLLDQLPEVLAPGGSAFFEAAPATIAPLASLCERSPCVGLVEIGEDYAGCERFVHLSLHVAGRRSAGERARTAEA